MNDSEPTVSEHAELVRVDEIVHGRAVVTFHPTEYGTCRGNKPQSLCSAYALPRPQGLPRFLTASRA